MPATDKPMLTKQQLDDYFRSDRISSHAYNTIESAVELLEHALMCTKPHPQCQQCKDGFRLLNHYHSTTAASNANQGGEV